MKKTSVANSGAIENNIGLQEETTIRPGLMLYGIQSTQIAVPHWQGKVISSLKAEVLDIRPTTGGVEVGYGSTPIPEQWGNNALLCVLGIGHGDGIGNPYQGLTLSRSLPTKQFRGKIIGQVSMDMLQIVFPPQTPIKRGDLLPIWSHNQNDILNIVKPYPTQPLRNNLFHSIRAFHASTLEDRIVISCSMRSSRPPSTLIVFDSDTPICEKRADVRRYSSTTFS